MSAINSRSLDSKARRRARKAGLIARRSRRLHPLENHGEFMLVEPSTGFPVAGFKYDMSAAEVLEFCR